jgi:quercetin dioxygenase-like cupin family protein
MGNIIFSGPNDGEPVGRGLLRVGADELTVLEYTLEAGSEAGEPHVHRRHADAFLVIEGELEFPTGPERTLRAPAGSLVVAPPGVVHAFPRALTERARFLNVHAPGGFHRTLRELIEIRESGQEPTPEFQERHDGFPAPWPAP